MHQVVAPLVRLGPQRRRVHHRAAHQLTNQVEPPRHSLSGGSRVGDGGLFVVAHLACRQTATDSAVCLPVALRTTTPTFLQQARERVPI